MKYLPNKDQRNIQRIIEQAAHDHGVTVEQIKSGTTHTASNVRGIVIAAVRERYPNASLQFLADMFNRSRAGILLAGRKSKQAHPGRVTSLSKTTKLRRWEPAKEAAV